VENPTENIIKEKPIRILIADDHKMFRQGLAGMIEGQPDLEVVGEAHNGRTAVDLSLKLLPDIVLMDISFPDFNGIIATQQIIEKAPAIRIIALSMHDGVEYIQSIMKSGASGYLVKDCEFKELIQAIRVVYQGKSYLCPSIAGIVIDSYVRRNTGTSGAQLTERESEVLHGIADGMSTKKIGESLGISAKTIETHRRKVMKKLGIYSIAQLTKFAVREGLSPLEP
jgi:DNA-binding NarL/FixJ family response regulator